MPFEITVIIYTMEEVRAELAARTGKPEPYSRKRVYELAERYLESRSRIQGTFLLTEDDVQQIARSIKPVGRPKRNS
jgi:hypothetical protein